MRNLIRFLFLWPFLWWPWTEAAWCQEQFNPPPLPLALDLSGISQGAIEKTVLHLQQLVHEAEARADSLAKHLSDEHDAHVAAREETAKLQSAVDALNAQVATLTKERDEWRTRARWLMLAASVLAAIAIAHLTRLLPSPWNWIAPIAAGGATYAALYLIL